MYLTNNFAVLVFSSGSSQCQCSWHSCSGCVSLRHQQSPHWYNENLFQFLLILLRRCMYLVEESDIVFPRFLLGGADKNVVVFDKSEEQIVVTLKGHAKKVTSVIFHPSQVMLPFSCSFFVKKIQTNKWALLEVPFLTLLSFLLQSMVFSASPDATIRVWSVTGGNCVQVVRAHEAGVTGLSLHATGDYLLSSSEDQVCFQLKPLNKQKNPTLSCFIFLTLMFFFQYWAFSDIQTGRVLTKVTDETAGCGKSIWDYFYISLLA